MRRVTFFLTLTQLTASKFPSSCSWRKPPNSHLLVALEEGWRLTGWQCRCLLNITHLFKQGLNIIYLFKQGLDIIHLFKRGLNIIHLFKHYFKQYFPWVWHSCTLAISLSSYLNNGSTAQLVLSFAGWCWCYPSALSASLNKPVKWFFYTKMNVQDMVALEGIISQGGIFCLFLFYLTFPQRKLSLSFEIFL